MSLRELAKQRLAEAKRPKTVEERLEALEAYVEHLKMFLPDDIPTPEQVASWQVK